MTALDETSTIPTGRSVSVRVEMGAEEPYEGWTVTQAAQLGWEAIQGLKAPIVDVVIEVPHGEPIVVTIDLEEVSG